MVCDVLMKESIMLISRGAQRRGEGEQRVRELSGGESQGLLLHLGGVKGCLGSTVQHLSPEQQERLCGDQLSSQHKGCPVFFMNTHTLKHTKIHDP